MKINNKGLSLIELIIAIAIFAIAGAAVCGFIIFCTHQFTNSNRSVALQYEQQIVVNRVRDIVLETSRGISYDDTNRRLLVFSDNPDYLSGKEGAEPYTITELSFSKTDGDEVGKFYIADSDFPEGTVLSGVSFSDSSKSVLSDSMSEFKVLDFDKNLEDNKVILEMTFKVGNKEITVNPVITLRNLLTKVTDETDLSDVYKGEVIEVYSHVQKVEISRDGHVFAQSKMDTIAMAGDLTSVDYDAIVTKKSTYKDSIDTTVTWELDPGTLRPGYEDYIKLDTATGMITVVSDENHTPNDFVNGGYFVLKAISNEDTSKIARLRIKITTGGVYPESIATVMPHAYVADLIHGTLVYTFAHEITYTDKIEDPITKSLVNPLTGKGVYSKITYRATCTDGSSIPEGAGFTKSDAVNGEFIVTKSMEEKTYHIEVIVSQRDKKGDVVKDEFDLTIEKDSVPETKTYSYPVLNVGDTALRGEFNAMTASWSSGVPTHEVTQWLNNKQANVTIEKPYRYFYEWEIEPIEINPDKPVWIKDDDGNVTYKGDERNYWKNIYFSTPGNSYDNKGDKYSSSQANRTAVVYVKPYLNWENTFAYKISLRVKLSADDNAQDSDTYFMEPGTDPTDVDNIFTTDRSKAFVASHIVKIDPVKLTLTPAEGVVMYKNNQKVQGVFNSVISTSEKIGLGKKHEHNIYYCDAEEHYYYKIFEPKFEGISISIFNYSNNLKGILHEFETKKDGQVVDKTSALQTYTKASTGIEYKVRDVSGYSEGWEVIDRTQRLYFYLKLNPYKWLTTDRVPVGARWVCAVYDDKGNMVRGTFSTTGNEFINYAFYNAYEGEYK